MTIPKNKWEAIACPTFDHGTYVDLIHDIVMGCTPSMKSKIVGYITITGLWYAYPSEKYDFVSWDYSSQLNEKIKNVPNHQPDYIPLFFVIGKNKTHFDG